MTSERLEQVIGLVFRVGIAVSSACLAAGLLLSFSSLGAEMALWLLQAGLIVLLATPVARVVVSVVEYTLERDWTFAVLTLIVLVELAASVVAAVSR